MNKLTILIALPALALGFAGCDWGPGYGDDDELDLQERTGVYENDQGLFDNNEGLNQEEGIFNDNEGLNQEEGIFNNDEGVFEEQEQEGLYE